MPAARRQKPKVSGSGRSTTRVVRRACGVMSGDIRDTSEPGLVKSADQLELAAAGHIIVDGSNNAHTPTAGSSMPVQLVKAAEDVYSVALLSAEDSVPTLSVVDAAATFDLEELFGDFTEAAERAAFPAHRDVPREPTQVQQCSLSGAGLEAATIWRETSFEVRLRCALGASPTL